MLKPARHRLYDQAAQQYDRARPGYPGALFDDLLAFAQMPQDGRILEVGCGSGQASVPLARRGFNLDCIEISENLAAIARGKLAAYPGARVIIADFNTCDLPESAFDSLVSATAFHWLDAATRFHKARRALRPSGTIALFWHRPARSHISADSIDKLQQVYRQQAPELSANWQPPPHPDAMPDEYSAIIAASDCFHPAVVKRYRSDITCSADEYIDLLGTFSDHLALDADSRRHLLAAIKRVINDECGGSITREQVATLYLARRKA